MATDLDTLDFYAFSLIVCGKFVMDKKRTVWTASQSVILLRAAVERHDLFLVR